MAFDVARRSSTGVNWSRDAVTGEAETATAPRTGIVVGMIASLAAIGSWLVWSGKKPPATKKKNATFIMAKTPSGRVYAGPMAGYYRKV